MCLPDHNPLIRTTCNKHCLLGLWKEMTLEMSDLKTQTKEAVQRKSDPHCFTSAFLTSMSSNYPLIPTEQWWTFSDLNLATECWRIEVTNHSKELCCLCSERWLVQWEDQKKCEFKQLPSSRFPGQCLFFLDLGHKLKEKRSWFFSAHKSTEKPALTSPIFFCIPSC